MKSGLKDAYKSVSTSRLTVTTSTAMKSGLKDSSIVFFVIPKRCVTTSTAMKSGLKEPASRRIHDSRQSRNNLYRDEKRTERHAMLPHPTRQLDSNNLYRDEKRTERN